MQRIECRECNSPYCDGCNLHTLSQMLHGGKLDRLMDEHRSIISNIEAIPVRHAEWECIEDFGDGNCYGYCSNCKTMHRANNPTALKMEYRHCRWCGAKMDKED